MKTKAVMSEVAKRMADMAKRAGSGVQQAAGMALRFAERAKEFVQDMRTKAQPPQGS